MYFIAFRSLFNTNRKQGHFIMAIIRNEVEKKPMEINEL